MTTTLPGIKMEKHEEKEKAPRKRDPELVAISRIGQILDGLDLGAAERVLSYVVARCNSRKGAVNADVRDV